MIQAWPPVGVPGSEPTSLSFCPLFKWRCVEHLPSGNVPLDGAGLQSVFTVGSRQIDYPTLQILLMFAPSVGLLKATARAGLGGSWRKTIPGLKEALERSRVKVGRD